MYFGACMSHNETKSRFKNLRKLREEICKKDNLSWIKLELSKIKESLMKPETPKDKVISEVESLILSLERGGKCE